MAPAPAGRGVALASPPVVTWQAQVRARGGLFMEASDVEMSNRAKRSRETGRAKRNARSGGHGRRRRGAALGVRAERRKGGPGSRVGTAGRSADRCVADRCVADRCVADRRVGALVRRHFAKLPRGNGLRRDVRRAAAAQLCRAQVGAGRRPARPRDGLARTARRSRAPATRRRARRGRRWGIAALGPGRPRARYLWSFALTYVEREAVLVTLRTRARLSLRVVGDDGLVVDAGGRVYADAFGPQRAHAELAARCGGCGPGNSAGEARGRRFGQKPQNRRARTGWRSSPRARRARGRMRGVARVAVRVDVLPVDDGALPRLLVLLRAAARRCRVLVPVTLNDGAKNGTRRPTLCGDARGVERGGRVARRGPTKRAGGPITPNWQAGGAALGAVDVAVDELLAVDWRQHASDPRPAYGSRTSPRAPCCARCGARWARKRAAGAPRGGVPNSATVPAARGRSGA